MSRMLSLVSLLLALLVLAACSGDEEPSTSGGVATLAPLGTAVVTVAPPPQVAADAATGTVESTAVEAAPTASAVDAPASAPVLENNALAQLSSYRSTMAWSVVQGDNAVQQVTMQMAETTNPPARHVTMASAQGNFEFIQIGDVLWINADGQWQEVPAAGASAMLGQLVFTPEELNSIAAEDNVEFEFLGAETFNGVQTNHYRLLLDPNNLPEEMAAQDVRDLTAEIWVTDQPGLPPFAMRMLFNFTGTFEGLSESRFAMDWQVADVNANFAIEPPN